MTDLTPERRAEMRAVVGDRWALDFAERHARACLPITEDADGLTCDICGAELADWAAADEHVETHEGWAG